MQEEYTNAVCPEEYGYLTSAVHTVLDALASGKLSDDQVSALETAIDRLYIGDDEWEDEDLVTTCTAAQEIELTRAFGLEPDAELLALAEQEEYAQDHILSGAKDWS